MSCARLLGFQGPVVKAKAPTISLEAEVPISLPQEKINSDVPRKAAPAVPCHTGIRQIS